MFLIDILVRCRPDVNAHVDTSATSDERRWTIATLTDGTMQMIIIFIRLRVML